MKQPFVLSIFAAAGLTALSGSPISIAAAGNPPLGTIITVAGTGQAAHTGDGGPAARAAIDWPTGIAFDAAGNLYVAEGNGNHVRRISPDGIISTVAGSGEAAFSGDGGPATDARLDTPSHLAFDGAGNLFIADSRNVRIRRVSPVGIISTVAGTGQAGFSGDGAPATQAELSGPAGLALDKAGDLFFSDLGRFLDAPTGFVTDGNQRIREVVGAGVPR